MPRAHLSSVRNTDIYSTLIALGRALTGQAELDIGAATASVSRYQRDKGGKLGDWTCTHNCDTSFLSRGAEVCPCALSPH